MKPRIDYKNVPEALRGMYQLEHYIHNSGLEESLVHLVKMRASQINGCPIAPVAPASRTLISNLPRDQGSSKHCLRYRRRTPRAASPV